MHLPRERNIKTLCQPLKKCFAAFGGLFADAEQGGGHIFRRLDVLGQNGILLQNGLKICPGQAELGLFLIMLYHAAVYAKKTRATNALVLTAIPAACQ